MRRLEEGADALGEKREDLIAKWSAGALASGSSRRLRLRRRLSSTVRRDAEVDEAIEAGADLPLVAVEQDLYDALRGAAQRERILRAGRLRADLEEARDRVDLVGDRDDRAAQCSRQRVVDVDRQVVIVDRLPNIGRITFFAGVDAADLSLQIGEFLHHLRDQIGLAELRRDQCSAAALCGAAALGGVSVRFRRRGRRRYIDRRYVQDLRGDGGDALRLLEVVAELLLKLQVRELVEALLELLLAIGLVEELRVGEARVRDERVAVRGVAFGVGLVVEHREERIRERVVRAADRQLLLVHAHDRDEYFFGKLQVFGAKVGAHEAGVFGEVLPLRPDRGIERRRAAGLVREYPRALGHHVAPPCDVDDHARLFELVHVVVVRRDLDPLRRERAMSDRRRA